MSKSSDMGARCRKHPSMEPAVGVCSVCLRERLARIADEQNGSAHHTFADAHFHQSPPVNLGDSGNRYALSAASRFNERVINHFQDSYRVPAILDSLPRSNSAAAVRHQHTLIRDEVQRNHEKSRKSFSLLTLLRNVDDGQRSSFSSSYTDKVHANKQLWRARSKEDGAGGNCSSLSVGRPAKKGSEEFICMDLERNEPRSWLLSLLLGKSKHKQSLQRKSVSSESRPSFEAGRPSLDSILSRKSPSYYEKEMSRRQEALRAGGWELELSPVDHNRHCSDCDEEKSDYFSDSSVLRKRRTTSISSLFRKGSHFGDSTSQVSKEKKNAKVANCMVSLAANGCRAKSGLNMDSKYDEKNFQTGAPHSSFTTSWARTLSSPVRKPMRNCSGRQHGVDGLPYLSNNFVASSSSCSSRSPVHLSRAANQNPSNYAFFFSPLRPSRKLHVHEGGDISRLFLYVKSYHTVAGVDFDLIRFKTCGNTAYRRTDKGVVLFKLEIRAAGAINENSNSQKLRRVVPGCVRSKRRGGYGGAVRTVRLGSQGIALAAPAYTAVASGSPVCPKTPCNACGDGSSLARLFLNIDLLRTQPTLASSIPIPIRKFSR
eukprot:Gb_26278 [translate_table: standard]